MPRWNMRYLTIFIEKDYVKLLIAKKFYARSNVNIDITKGTFRWLEWAPFKQVNSMGGN